MTDAVEQLRALSTRRVRVTRARRGVHLATCAAAPLIGVAAFLVDWWPSCCGRGAVAGCRRRGAGPCAGVDARLGRLPMLGVVRD